LCAGLLEKLEQIENINFQLEVRDIASREDWFAAYQYEVPVLAVDTGTEQQLPRPSPRATVQQVERMLQKYLPTESKDKVKPRVLKNPFAARYREGVVENIEGVGK